MIGETVAPSETDPTFASAMLSTDTVTPGMVKISLQELADSAFDLEAWLRTKFGQRYGRGLEATVTNGNASNVASLVASAHAAVTALGNTNHPGSDGGNSIGYADIAAMYAALDPAYIANATWLINSNSRGCLMGVTDPLGRPLFIPNPSS